MAVSTTAGCRLEIATPAIAPDVPRARLRARVLGLWPQPSQVKHELKLLCLNNYIQLSSCFANHTYPRANGDGDRYRPREPAGDRRRARGSAAAENRKRASVTHRESIKVRESTRVVLGDIQKKGVARCSLDSCLLLSSFFA